MICVSLGSQTPEQAFQICNEVKMVEIRADLLSWSFSDYRKILSTGIKTIITCRPGIISDPERLELFEFAAKEGASFMDMEIESDENFRQKILEIKNKYQTELIVSYHNFDATPDRQDLETILAECYLKSADVAKIACRTYSTYDVARLLALYEKPGRKVLIGMGNTGKITRLASVLLGAEFTFCSASDQSKTAEGQIDYKTMIKINKLLNYNV